jgi:hypothetical protein
MTSSKPRTAVTESTGGGSAGSRRWVDGEWTVAPFRQNAGRNTRVGQALKRLGSIPVADMNETVLQSIEEYALTREAIEQAIHRLACDEVADQQATLARERKGSGRG